MEQCFIIYEFLSLGAVLNCSLSTTLHRLLFIFSQPGGSARSANSGRRSVEIISHFPQISHSLPLLGCEILLLVRGLVTFLLLLLTTSAPASLQHSRNHIQVLFPSPIHRFISYLLPRYGLRCAVSNFSSHDRSYDARSSPRLAFAESGGQDSLAARTRSFQG